MNIKINEKIKDLEQHILKSFNYAKSDDDSALNSIRKACEAICKIIIIKNKGESIGLKIINGEINYHNFTANSGDRKSLDLHALIDACKKNKWFSNKAKENTAIFHKLDELRFGGNQASHDNTDKNDNPTSDDIEYCIINFKKLVNWFWKKILNIEVSQEILMVLNLNNNISVTTNVQNNTWEQLLNLSNNFGPTTQNFLVAPKKFDNLSSNQLLALSKINWNIIFDFDSDSKNSGLFLSFSVNKNKNLRPISIEQLQQKNLSSSSKHSINWIFCAGIAGLDSTLIENYKEWRSKKYISLIEKVVEEYVNQSSISNVNLFVLSSEITYVEKIIEIISDKYPDALLNIIILSDDQDKFFSISEKFENISILDLSIPDFVKLVDSFIESKILDNKAIQIPAKIDDKDMLIDIQKSYLTFLEKNIEIVHATIHLTDNNENSPLQFYQGGVINWSEIANEIEVRRDIESEVADKIESYLIKQSAKGPIIDLLHSPGSGGTTLARKIAFKFKERYPVVVINKYNKNITNQGLFDLSELSKKPILAIVESHNINLNDLSAMIRENNASKKHIVYLYIQRFYSIPKNFKNKPSEVYLRDTMVSIDERERFISKFCLNIPTKKLSIEKLSQLQPSECEVIDFSLTAFEDEFSKNKIINYVQTYFNKIPQNQKEFVVFTCLYYYYTQGSTSEYWFYKKFVKKSLTKELKVGIDFGINKLLIREKNDDGDYTGFWRPRFNQFAKNIISVALDPTEKDNWKDFLSEWAIMFIEECRESNEFLIDEIRIAFKKMFLLRNNEDAIGLDNIDESQNKFSQFIYDIKDSSKQKLVLKKLTTSYPNEAHFRAHYGRFLFEKQESEQDLDLAKSEISEAITLGHNDYNLWHLKGMCNRRNIEFRINNSLQLEPSEFDNFFQWLKEETEEAQTFFFNSKEIRSDNLHCHTAEIQMLIRVINFAKEKLYPDHTMHSFLMMSENSWYESQLNKILELIEEANYIIELSTDMDNAKHMRTARTMIEDGEAKTFRLLGNISKSIDKYKQLSETAQNSSRPYFRKMFVYSTLVSKVENDFKKMDLAWSLLSAYEINEILKLINSNIHDQPENSSNYKIWLKCVRYSSMSLSLDEVINKIKIWYDNCNSNKISRIEATYYLYAFNAISLIEAGDSLNKIQLDKTINYIKESKEITTNDKFNFEWLGKGVGAKRILNYLVLGSIKNEDSKLFEDDSKLQEVEGIITVIDGRQKGTIKLKCGLEAFFVPAIGKFEKGKDETLKVTFFISFRYDGLHAWHVKRQDISRNTTKIEIKVNEPAIKTIKDLFVPTNKISYSGFVKISKPNILGKIDLDKLKK